MSLRWNEGWTGASVVIPTFNGRDVIEPVLQAALRDEATREVIVVVDGSDDGTYERLLEIAREESRVRPTWQANRGTPAARQRGVDIARYPVVVLLDDDVVADPGIITGHVAHHARRDHQLVLGYMPVGNPSGWRERITACLYSLSYEDQCRRYEGDAGQVLYALWAGNMSLRRSDALHVGLDEAAVRLDYLEDRELGLRMMKCGFTGVFDRSLRATHLYSRSLKSRRHDAEKTGRDKWKLHKFYCEILGPVSPDPWEGAAWGPRLVITLGLGRAGAAVRALLIAVAYTLGRLGTARASARHFGLLCQIDEQRAFLAASRQSNSVRVAASAPAKSVVD